MSITVQMLMEIDEVIAKHLDNADAIKALVEVKAIIKKHEIKRIKRNITATQTLKERVMAYITQLHDSHRRATVLGVSKKFHIPSQEARQYLAMAK